MSESWTKRGGARSTGRNVGRSPTSACLDCGRLTHGSRCPSCRNASPYPTAEWRRVARNVTARDGSCRLCGGTNRLSAHHVIPRAENGSDTPENLVTLCVGCPAWVVDKAVQVGVVAVDGTKIAAAATHHATRSYEQSAREILEDAGRIDAAEMSRSGGARRRVAREAADER